MMSMRTIRIIESLDGHHDRHESGMRGRRSKGEGGHHCRTRRTWKIRWSRRHVMRHWTHRMIHGMTHGVTHGREGSIVSSIGRGGGRSMVDGIGCCCRRHGRGGVEWGRVRQWEYRDGMRDKLRSRWRRRICRLWTRIRRLWFRLTVLSPSHLLVVFGGSSSRVIVFAVDEDEWEDNYGANQGQLHCGHTWIGEEVY
jgi:hypothetical protein